MEKFNLLECLNYIDPAALDYSQWCQVGMALKAEGYSDNDWDSWSQLDSSRYHTGDCEKKWKTFNDSGITGASITKMANIMDKKVLLVQECVKIRRE